MSSHIWSYKEPLSDNIRSYIEAMTEHLKKSEYDQLITKLENQLGDFIQEEKNQLNAQNAIEKKEKITSILNHAQQLRVEINEIIDEEYADGTKVHLLENDEDQWLKLKVLELDLPNHQDSLDEIIIYLKMLDSLKDTVYKDNSKIPPPQQLFFSQFKKILNEYNINVEKFTHKNTSENENKVHHLYRLIMKQIGIKKIEVNEFK